MRILLWLALSTVVWGAFSPYTCYGQMRKWVDQDGVVHFTNKPAGWTPPVEKKTKPKSDKKLVNVATGPAQANKQKEDKGAEEKKGANKPKLDEIHQLQAEIERLKNAPGSSGDR